MITTLDTLSWSPELVTGNADFIEATAPGFGVDFGHNFGNASGPTIFVVSNVRTNGTGPQGFGYGFGAQFGSAGFSFEVLQSEAFPPTPGPGSIFDVVATYIFPQPNLTFDPMVAYDASGVHPVIHIVGTRNTPTGFSSSSSQSSDLIKFTYDTVTQILTGPFVLSSGTRIRSAYDIIALPNGNQIVVMSLAEPAIQGANQITFVSVDSDVATLTIGGSLPPPFVPGQWVLLDDFTNASFLNGQIVQVISSNAGEFSFVFPLLGSYSGAESGTPSAYAKPVGDTLLALELNNAATQGSPASSNDVIPGSATIIESSPARSGDAFDGVSLVSNGNTIELYYQTHPKLVTFQDQVFTIKTTNFGPASPTPAWALPATTITTYTARYSDNRLTVLADANNDRYLSQTYWKQFNHPYGIVGNVLLGYKPDGGSWSFRATLGTFVGGSIVQSTLAIDQSGAANLMYLLQPFDQIANPPSTTTAAYPLQVATIDPSTLVFTNVPGFYNSVNFTWLRGTKSLLDNETVWALVGEREVLTIVSGERHTIPVVPGPFAVQVLNHSAYFENIAVTYTATGLPLVQVVTAPTQGQYTVEPSTGLYTFNIADAGMQVTFSYNYVSSILPAYVSSFNVPPVAEIAPESVVVWRGSTFYSTDLVSITQIEFNYSNSSITIVCNNDFVVGDEVALYNIGTDTFLNGVTLFVSQASPTQFTALVPAELAAFFAQQLPLGFGFKFGFAFGNVSYSNPDTGIVANLTTGAITFSAAGSTDADNDAMEFFWSENDPDLADVTLTPNGSQATLNVARHVGPNSRSFNVGVAVVDLFPDLVTQRHPALLVSNVSVLPQTFSLTSVAASVGTTAVYTGTIVNGANNAFVGVEIDVSGFTNVANNGIFTCVASTATTLTLVNSAAVTETHSAVATGNLITVTFVPPVGVGFGFSFGIYFGSPSPSNATIPPVPGDQVMLYGMTLSPPQPPVLGQVPGGSLPPQNNLSVIVTYVNNAGETVGSGNSLLNVAANHLLIVNSPNTNGSATAYNVYAGAPGSETLQTLTPQPFGSPFIELAAGLRASFHAPPLTNTALETALNDQVLNIISTTATTFTAPFTLSGAFGLDFGNNFGNGTYAAALLTGYAINEFQWDVANVFVPKNVAPTITFPLPQWGAGNVLDTTLTRNTQITISPTPNAGQFSVVYGGIYDPDDLVTYLWTQTSGTPVTIVGGSRGPSFSFLTNGVSINGEALTFTETVSDSVNPPVTVSFTVNVVSVNLANAKDTLQLSRSIWSQTADVISVGIAGGVATVTSNNNFLVGEPIRLSGLTTATFLNGVVGFVKSVASAGGFGEDFGASFGIFQQFTFSTTFADYPSSADTGLAYATTPISQRNLPQVWSPLDISVLFSDLSSVKRVSVIDGSDRYIVISPYSVLVYAVFPSANPVAVLLRRLITPKGTLILDAVHTEQDYTLVLDNAGNIFRYSTAPLINTDNPDTTLVLAKSTSLSFADPDLDSDVKIMTTQSFANTRIVVLSGEQGAVLLQLNTTTLAVLGVLTFLTSDNLLYGANAIQFVRWVNMDNLRTGRVLLGSVVYNSAKVTSVAIAANALTITGQNTFAVGNRIVLSGMTNATFLNGVTVTVINATATQFEASLEFAGSYGPIVETSGFAESQTSGTTYETLVDLSQGQIIGTWDKSKLRNQFVETGEILFTPDSTYSGAPIPPVLLTPSSSVVGGQTFVTLTWQQERPDLINSYIVSYAIETQDVGTVPLIAPYTFQIPIAFTFTADEGVVDTTSPIAITSIQVSPVGFGVDFGHDFGGNLSEITVTGNNNFSVGQSVQITGLTGIPALIGQTLVISSASPTGFTALFVHANYGLPNTVTNVQVASNVLTIHTGTTHTFLPGTQVTFNSISLATFLNGQTVTVLASPAPTATSFSANFTFFGGSPPSGNYGPTGDSGNVVDADTGSGFVTLDHPLTAVAGTPLAGQYTVTPNGLYTFNAAQAGHTVTFSLRQSFNTLQSVGSGATQSITVLLVAGQTYFFEVEAFGLDGASGESNVVSITI